jgi:hypothetical protein
MDQTGGGRRTVTRTYSKADAALNQQFLSSFLTLLSRFFRQSPLTTCRKRGTSASLAVKARVARLQLDLRGSRIGGACLILWPILNGVTAKGSGRCNWVATLSRAEPICSIEAESATGHSAT